MDTPEPKLSQLDSLVSSWIDHFWSADHSLVFEKAEHELSVQLTPQIKILLVGRIDAIGRLNSSSDQRIPGRPFFADWKTASPRKAKTWKAGWRLSPQALTYGVLLSSVYPDMRTFLVRQAFKTNPPTFDHEWFEYEEAELKMWKEQILEIGEQILESRIHKISGPWIPNFGNCFRYGHGEYQCPYFDHGCSELKFDSKQGLVTRVSHLEVERNLTHDPSVVVLDATRIGEWLGCQEKYRKEYEENLRPEETNSALQLGLDFHEMLNLYYEKLIKKEL